jgi:hypothetical protein
MMIASPLYLRLKGTPMSQTRAMFFPDWDLEAIVSNMNTDRDDDFAHAVELIQQGQLDEADSLLQVEMSRFPWVMLAAAHIQLQKENIDEAKRLLRAVTLVSQETILQLWAWHNLRRLGRSPSPAVAQQVLGIVIEVPYQGSSDVLASYMDGTARYLNHQGGLIVWDTYDEEITPLIFEGIRMARPMGGLEQFHTDEPVTEGEVRLCTLTPAGVYIWEGSPEDGSDISRLFAQQANLLRAIVRMVLNRKDNPDDE